MSLDLDENEIKGCSLRRIVKLSKQMGGLVYFREFVESCGEMVASKVEHLVNRLENLVMLHRVMLAPEINLVQLKKEISSALNWLHIVRRTSSELVRDLASMEMKWTRLDTDCEWSSVDVIEHFLLEWWSIEFGNGTRKSELWSVNELPISRNWNALLALESLLNVLKDDGLCHKVELLRQLVQPTLSECELVEKIENRMTSVKLKKLGTSGTLKVCCHQCDTCDTIGLFKTDLT